MEGMLDTYEAYKEGNESILEYLKEYPKTMIDEKVILPATSMRISTSTMFEQPSLSSVCTTLLLPRALRKL